MVDTDTGSSLGALDRRITVHTALQIMEANFPDFAFHHVRDVDDLCNLIEQRIKEYGYG
ncbi:MAG: hypothetical protein JJ897_01990 [Marinibacterium sp.]|nr:hypothetical protein [Marinibacterium sp.]